MLIKNQAIGKIVTVLSLVIVLVLCLMIGQNRMAVKYTDSITSTPFPTPIPDGFGSPSPCWIYLNGNVYCLGPMLNDEDLRRIDIQPCGTIKSATSGQWDTPNEEEQCNHSNMINAEYAITDDKLYIKGIDGNWFRTSLLSTAAQKP